MVLGPVVQKKPFGYRVAHHGNLLMTCPGQLFQNLKQGISQMKRKISKLSDKNLKLNLFLKLYSIFVIVEI